MGDNLQGGRGKAAVVTVDMRFEQSFQLICGHIYVLNRHGKVQNISYLMQ